MNRVDKNPGKVNAPTPNTLNLLYIGSVPIRLDRSGGSVVLWRHQQLFSAGTVTAAADGIGYCTGLGAAIWRLLCGCRLGQLALILQPWLHAIDIHLTANQQLRIKSQADAILTVAHGLGWIEALAIARTCHLPLITIVHDWYPDASGCPHWGLWVWDHSFRQLMRRSDVVFAVSKGMAQSIGTHPNLQVLPPIPDPALQPCPPRKLHSSLWRLYYAGFCGGLYSPLLQTLIDAVAADERYALHCSGSEAGALAMPADHPRLRRSGFLEGDAWQQAFEEADALVLVLSFEQRHRRHLITHFPSKLVEYANRGRPIIIWGPLWSSAVQWGQDKPEVLCIWDSSPQQVLQAADIWLAVQTCSTAVVGGLQAHDIANQFNQSVIQALQR